MEKSSFFDSDVINGQYDRVYSAEDFASYFNTVLTTGIFPSPSTNLQVVANNNMTVTVKSGDAFINGYMYHNTDDLTLELNTADGVLKRIDLVVVRLDHVNREIKCHIKTGTFGSSPVKPSLTRNEEVYELCLAEINIGNGIISINQDSIIDTRYNSSVCGVVNSLIEIDTEEIYSQMRGLIEQREEEFFKWFNDLKVNLEGDVATNLQGQINVLEDDVLINNTSEDLLNEDVNSFKVGTGTVEGIKKDYTNQMKQSIVTLDNIQGKTVKEDTTLLSSEIFRLYSSNFPKITDIEKAQLGKSLNPSTGELKVSENYYVSQYINIEPNTLYLFENIDANICFYDVNGNFISNYDNSHNNNNMHIFGFYGLHRYSFYVTTPKNASTVRCTVHNNANPSIVRVKDYYEPKISLCSLPNGVCDEIKDGELIQRVGQIVLNGSEKWVQAGNSQGKVQFICENILSNYKHSTGDSHFDTGGYYTKFWIKKGDHEGELYNGECIRIYDGGNNYGHVYIKKNNGDVNVVINDLKQYPITLIYELAKPIITPINVSILANSNDTINIDTPIPLSCTHKVSLNTKSQIEELQEVVKKEKKSVWQKIKELTNFKFELNENGYLKFPSILGGLTIQWVSNTVTGNSYKSFGLPISFDYNVLYYIGTLTGEVPGNSVMAFGDVSKSGFKAKHTVNNNTLTFKAFFIGY